MGKKYEKISFKLLHTKCQLPVKIKRSRYKPTLLQNLLMKISSANIFYGQDLLAQTNEANRTEEKSGLEKNRIIEMVCRFSNRYYYFCAAINLICLTVSSVTTDVLKARRCLASERSPMAQSKFRFTSLLHLIFHLKCSMIEYFESIASTLQHFK